MKRYTDQARTFVLHLSGRVGQVSPAQRVSFMIAVAVLAVMAIWWTRGLEPATETLYADRNLSQSELDGMADAFIKSKLSGFSILDGEIRIPQGESYRFVEALTKHSALPRPLAYHRRVTTQDSRLFETTQARRYRLDHALEQDLVTAICAMDDVADAFVHFDQAVEPGLRPKRIATASVGVAMHETARLPRSKFHTIRRFVASAKAGMDVSDVTVTDLNSGRSVSGDASEDTGMGWAQDYVELKRQLEQVWQQKISNVLAFVPDAQVVTSIELADLKSAPHPEASAPRLFRHVGISVSVPASHHRRRTQDNPAGLTVAQMRDSTELRIKRAIHGLISEELATVAVTTFDDRSSSPVSTTWGPWISANRIRHWTGAAAFLIAAVGVLVFQLMPRNKPESAPEGAIIAMSADDRRAGGLGANSVDSDGDDELRATLTDRIQSDPDQAARVLNQWLTRAG